MPAKLERCVRKTKVSLKKAHPDWDSKKISSVAWASCVKSTGLKPHSESDLMVAEVDTEPISCLQDVPFHFTASVTNPTIESLGESASLYSDEELVLEGKAINATLTKNWRYYSEEELSLGGKTLENAPVVKDHYITVDNTIGRVREQWYDAANKVLMFRAGIDKKDSVVRKIKLGHIDKVSVGGSAKEINCSVCGKQLSWTHKHIMGKEYEGQTAYGIVKGIMFKELSLTPLPADDDAGFTVANSFADFVSGAIEFIESFHENEKNLKFGESSLSADIPEEAKKAIQEAERLKVQLEEQDTELEALKKKEAALQEAQKKIKDFEDKAHARLVQEVLETEIQLKKTEEKNKTVRETELAEKSEIALEARLEALQEQIKAQPPVAPGSRSMIDPQGSIPAPMSEARVKEHKMRNILKEMGYSGRVSQTAVNTLDDYDDERGKWKSRFDGSK